VDRLAGLRNLAGLWLIDGGGEDDNLEPQISDDALEALASATSLTSLEFMFTHFINDKGVQALAGLMAHQAQM